MNDKIVNNKMEVNIWKKMFKKETHGIWKSKRVWKGLNAILESNHQIQKEEKEYREELRLSE